MFRSIALAALVAATPAAARDVPFNQGWQFHRDGAAFDPARAEPVTLPHTARIEPRIVNDQWQGDAWYAKTFDAPADWQGQTVLLRFEAAMNVADVWVNGTKVTTHLGGFLPFTIDLTPHLTLGAANEIRVKLDNRDNAITGPKPLEQLDFNTYGGLYRGVRLIVKPPVHLTDEMLADRVAVGGLFVTYPAVSADAATIAIAADVANAGTAAAQASVTHRLYDGERLVAEARTTTPLAPGATARNDQRIELASPRLWSPRNPNLYRLVTTVEAGGSTDTTETRIGIRTLAITREGFSINGEAMFLRGVNRHQEYPYVGYAISPQADYRDAKAIKEAGFDYVRLSHYPHSPAFMAAADELGLVLIDAIPGWQFVNPDPAFRAQVMRTCRDMIRRDRNHASVIAWECSLNESAMPKDMVADFHRIVHEEYPGNQAWSAGWQNDGYDIFLQARQHRMQHYETPDVPYVVSEYGDWEYYAQNAGFAQDSWGDLKEEARTSRQALGAGEARLLQQAINVQEAHDDNLSTPAFADGYWAMFDYNRGYADDLEHSGVMSLERLPKFAWHFFRSQRSASERSDLYDSGPMVAIASYWTATSNPVVRVFSNADEIELRLNGRSLGRTPPTRDRIGKRLASPPFLFNVGGFAPGALEAIAYIGGVEVARDRVDTPGAATGYCVAIDDAGVPVGSRDLVFLRAHLRDTAGRPVPTHNARFAFTAPQGWELVGDTSAQSEGGIASVLIRAPDSPSAPSSFAARPIGSALTSLGPCTG
ncbi:glycoside hydrolase family 2 protein [Sphingomonas sp. AX6]|uniref:glycoside hydrolase family 2 protein n=1 Tax=Sphingomonas sp. AX6 TaxID=2653171 RepID=UPI0012F0AF18|nr:glycoside hydrolase family 2 TIM barrel-domain containing protein [Sphingomonas sp. AX6]VXC73230.1 Beta-galactosidase [Sphingomonas sp. AX6]